MQRALMLEIIQNDSNKKTLYYKTINNLVTKQQCNKNKSRRNVSFSLSASSVKQVTVAIKLTITYEAKNI